MRPHAAADSIGDDRIAAHTNRAVAIIQPMIRAVLMRHIGELAVPVGQRLGTTFGGEVVDIIELLSTEVAILMRRPPFVAAVLVPRRQRFAGFISNMQSPRA